MVYLHSRMKWPQIHLQRWFCKKATRLHQTLKATRLHQTLTHSFTLSLVCHQRNWVQDVNKEVKRKHALKKILQGSWARTCFCPIMCLKTCVCVCVCVLGHVHLCATTWNVAHQGPLSMEFSRQEHWSWLPFPPPRDRPNSGTELASPVSPALAERFFTTESPEKPTWLNVNFIQRWRCQYLCKKQLTSQHFIFLKFYLKYNLFREVVLMP